MNEEGKRLGLGFPDGVVEVIQDLSQTSVEEFVESVETAALAFEEQIRIVDGGAVDETIGYGLGGQFLEPFALRIGPCLLYTSPSPRD